MGEGTVDAQVVAGFAVDLARHGDRPALRTVAGPPVTHAELDRRVAAARDALEALTPSTGRHLVRLSPAPTVEFVVSWLAALTGGHATLLSHDPALGAAYTASMEYDASGWRPSGIPAPALHPELRLLLSTSGSTGSPKLVRLSAANLDANAAAIASYLGLRDDDVALTTLPLDYCYGLSVLHSHLAAGASLLLDDRSVTEPGLWADARAHGVTSFAGVPYTFDLLGAAGWPQLPTLRQVTQAGGRMAPERVRTLAAQGEAEGWELVVMYGQTEATARMAYLPPRPRDHAPAVGGCRDPRRGLPAGPRRRRRAGRRRAGLLPGRNVMLGYAESPADLARGAEVDELRTGDLARISTDGLVEVVGRRSRFAKLFGQRIDLDRVQTLLGLGGYDAGCAESVDGQQLVVAVPGDPDVGVLAEVAATVGGDTGPATARHPGGPGRRPAAAPEREARPAGRGPPGAGGRPGRRLARPVADRPVRPDRWAGTSSGRRTRSSPSAATRCPTSSCRCASSAGWAGCRRTGSTAPSPTSPCSALLPTAHAGTPATGTAGTGGSPGSTRPSPCGRWRS